MFDRSNRFQDPALKRENQTGALDFPSFSDFVRQQTLQTRNVFSTLSATKRPQSAPSMGRVEKFLHETFIAKKNDGNEQQPSSSGTGEKLRINADLLYQEPESSEETQGEVQSPLRRKFRKRRAKSASAKRSSVAAEAPGMKNGVQLHPTLPGPGEYYSPTSFIKPSFNRVFTEPPPVYTPKSGKHASPRYLRHTQASVTHQRGQEQPAQGSELSESAHTNHNNRQQAEQQQQTDTITDEEKREEWRRFGGAFFNKSRYRLRTAPSSSRHPTATSPERGAGGEGGLEDSFPLTFRVKKQPFPPSTGPEPPPLHVKAQQHMMKETERLYGVRYPPISDEIIKRWESVEHSTYHAGSRGHRPVPTKRLVSGRSQEKLKKNHHS